MDGTLIEKRGEVIRRVLDCIKMENPFSSKEKGTGYWASPRAQMDVVTPLDGSPRNLLLEDPFNNFSELMNFDIYAEL